MRRLKNALLVDPNFSSLPLRRAIEARGFQVCTIGRAKAGDDNASDGNHISADYSDLDALASAVKHFDAVALIPGCTDISYDVCSRIAVELGLPGFESLLSTRSLHHKREFRELCVSLNLPTPKLYDDVHAAVADGRPIIVKPVDSYSGRGVSVVRSNSLEDVSQALGFAQQFSSNDSAVIEQFVEGQLYSYSAFLCGGVVSHAVLVAEYCNQNPFSVDVSFVEDYPQLKATLESDVNQLASELSLDSGLLHLQLIYDSGEYYLIEVTRRCPGDLYSELIRLSTGFDYSGAYVAPFLRTPLPEPNDDPIQQIVRQTLKSRTDALFEGLEFDEASRLVAFWPLLKAGETIRRANSVRAGIAFYALPLNETSQRFGERLAAGNVASVKYALK